MKKNNMYRIKDFEEIKRYIKMYEGNYEKKYECPVKPKYILIEHDKYRLKPIHLILGKPRFHSGFDITTRTTTTVKTSISGEVVAAGLDEKILSGVAR